MKGIPNPPASFPQREGGVSLIEIRMFWERLDIAMSHPFPRKVTGVRTALIRYSGDLFGWAAVATMDRFRREEGEERDGDGK